MARWNDFLGGFILLNAKFLFFFRDILITPKRLSYTREREKNLYESLIALTNSKQNEIQKLILLAISEMHETLADQACSVDIPGIELTDQLTVKHARDLKKCTNYIQEFVLIKLNETIANKLLDSINILHDNYVGTLTRCLFSLENNASDADESELSTSKALQEVNRQKYVQILFCSFEWFRFSIQRMK